MKARVLLLFQMKQNKQDAKEISLNAFCAKEFVLMVQFLIKNDLQVWEA